MEPRINERKKEAVGRIKETLGSAGDIIFTDYRGLTVQQITNLRDKLRETASTYKVVKNDYARIAMQQLGMADASSLLVGPTAIALIGRDVGPVAKMILDFTKDSPLQLKGALVGGRLFGRADVEALSRLPGRETLLAMLMGTMMAPMQNLVYVINGVTSKLVRTLAAVADKKKAE
jgi:large subunit ribosomal protein L10